MTRLLLAAGLALLAACSSVDTRAPDGGSWASHRARLAQFENWSAAGKLALHTSEISESASLDWRQRGEHTRLRLSGPLGAGATEIVSDGRVLDVRRGDERRSYELSPTGALPEGGAGWDLPLNSLHHWLKGEPAPNLSLESLELDPDSGLVQRLRQEGWEVSYERYGQFEALWLPTHLRIRAEDTRATILIRDWRADAS